MTYTFSDFMKDARQRQRSTISSFRVVHDGDKAVIEITTVGDLEDKAIDEVLARGSIDAEYEVLDSEPCRALRPLVE